MSTTPINLVELPNNAMVAHNHMWAIYEKNSSGQYVVVSPTKSVPINTPLYAVAGAEFQFIWNPDASAFTQSGYNVELAWPGAQYVDVIGLDLYDFSWSSSTEAGVWVNFLSQMNAADNFATAQGKPLAFCEWGVQALASHGFADDPTYITNMVTWMKSHNVVFEAYFNGDTTKAQDAYLGNYPNSLAAFTKALA